MISHPRVMKSPFKDPKGFYLELMICLISDIFSGTSFSEKKDIEVFSLRFSNEGLGFITKTLPLLGKALDLALETGSFVTPSGFSTKKGTNLPCFMHDKFKEIFHSDGTVLDHADPYSVQELRQLFFFAYKLDFPFTCEQKEAAIKKFAEVENEMGLCRFGSMNPKIVTRAQSLLERLFAEYDPKDIYPKHGPGGVNTGEKGNRKWILKRIYRDAFQCYPAYSYYLSSLHGMSLVDRISWYKSLSFHDESWSELCLVPKDSRGPRVISIEPLETQYLQQGQLKSLVSLIERHPLTKGFVNFTNQGINQSLALSSSVDKKFATLDLKEASDRIHVNLVRILFPENVTRHLFATRSTGTILPCGSKLPFRKFAPMGSANCFPVLALTIWSLARAYLDSIGCNDGVYVYGDDVVVPTAHAAGLIHVLEGANLRVNRDKSFIAGSFRESCGIDAYKGVVVTPLRLRRPWSGKSSDSSAFQSYTSLANNLFTRGFWQTASKIRSTCEKLYGKIPYGTPTSGFPCVEVDSPFLAEELNRSSLKKCRWADDLQRWEFRVRKGITPPSLDPIDGWFGVLKGILTPSDTEPSLVVHRQVPKLAWRWVAV